MLSYLAVPRDNAQWQGISDMVTTVCKFVRLRMRFHYGSNQECQYALIMTHGIPAETIPVTSEGDVDLTQHYEWIENRIILEASRHGMDPMQDQ